MVCVAESSSKCFSGCARRSASQAPSRGQFGGLGAQKLAPRRGVEEQVGNSDGGATSRAASSTWRILPPAISRRVPAASSPVAVSRVTRPRRRWRAEPRRESPGSQWRADHRRCAVLSGVALESQQHVVAAHAVAVVGDADEPPAAGLHFDPDRVAPASREFSSSSFTTDAGRSTTSPAAIWLATWSESMRMRPISLR